SSPCPFKNGLRIGKARAARTIWPPGLRVCTYKPCTRTDTEISSRKPRMRLFPLFLKLRNRRCLVVGAASIAESKSAGLMDTGAKMRVIAPKATPKIRSWARSRKVDWERRPFRLSDLKNIFLVIAATSSRELHEQIFSEAQRRGVLCNV